MKEIKKFEIFVDMADNNEKDETILQVVDERGKFTNIPIEGAKRCYIIENHQLNTVRAFHFHPKEEILLYCLKGAFKVVTYFRQEEKVLPDISVLSVTEPKVEVIKEGQFIEVLANSGNGHMNLQEGSIMLCFATLPLSEVVTEEVKEAWDKFGDIWITKRR